MQDKLIIEARINEYTLRGDNTHIPYTPAEIIQDASDCEAAGASIVHFHARDDDGAATMDSQTYLTIAQGIRQRSNVAIMPTLGAGTPMTTVDERMAHIRELARQADTLPEFAPIDMASTNLDVYQSAEKRFIMDNLTYENTANTLMQLASELRSYQISPVPVLWNVSSARLLEAFLESGVLNPPTYTQLSLTAGGMLAGHPPTEKGIQAFLDFLPAGPDCHWSVLCYGGNLLPLLEPILQRGGHIAIGIGDYAYPELGYPCNATLIENVVDCARALGRDIATPDEARELLS